jgi:hypothetical protein
MKEDESEKKPRIPARLLHISSLRLLHYSFLEVTNFKVWGASWIEPVSSFYFISLFILAVVGGFNILYVFYSINKIFS